MGRRSKFAGPSADPRCTPSATCASSQHASTLVARCAASTSMESAPGAGATTTWTQARAVRCVASRARTCI
eukprot:784242-Lingulodinium_polyedra.AAC.1